MNLWQICARISSLMLGTALITLFGWILVARTQADPGQLVFFQRDRLGARVFALDSLYGTQISLFAMPSRQPADLPRMTNNGQRMVYETYGESGLGITAFDLHNRKLYQTAPEFEDRLPSLSPDGTLLAFWSNRITPDIMTRRWQNWNFYILDLRTDTINQVTESYGILPYGVPLWSPDARHIVIHFWQPIVGQQMVIYHRDTGLLEEFDGIIETGSDLAWSHDGSRIAFRYNENRNNEVFVLDILTGESTNLTQNVASDFEPVWSPDSSQIAFTSTRTGRGEIHLMNADGSNVRQLTTGGGWHPVWSPAGTYIAFISSRDGTPAYYVIDTNGSNLRRAASYIQTTLLSWYTH